MPTAIITAYTRQGFFIAADGLSRHLENGVWVRHREDEQKVFRIADGRARFAYAVTGIARFTAEDETDILFDFNLAVPTVVDRLRSVTYANARSYCESLCQGVSELLHETVSGARNEGKTVRYPDEPDPNFEGHMIAHMILAGYYSGVPHLALFRFVPGDESLAPTSERLQEFVVNDSRILGSSAVAELLYGTDDARFAQFRSDGSFGAERSFRQWATLAKNYVAACESPAGLAADPEFAPRIGGHVHAATVTPGQGFKWIPGFEPTCSA